MIWIRSFWLLLLGPALLAGRSASVVYEHDFRVGADGWTALFADHPPGVEEAWGFAAGLAPLPAELEVAGTGFRIAGVNHSDDLAMFLVREIGPAEGLAPNQTYVLEYALAVASNAPSGAFGVGGSPGDSVYLKAGATSFAPTVTLVDDHLRPAFNPGVQATGGPAATVVGVIANGRDAAEPARYVSLGGIHRHTFPVTTDGEGRLWLVVGTDSAFEGPTALFYQRVRAVLTPVVRDGSTRLVNLATRARAAAGDETLIAGVVVAAPGARLLVRGVGPGLAEFGVPGPLAEPVLRLFNAAGELMAENADWRAAPDPAAITAAGIAAGAFPLRADEPDAALLVEVPAGTFTAQVTDAAGRAGPALAEIYVVPAASGGEGGGVAGRLVNLSARAVLGRDATATFGGLVVQGPHAERFLLRAVGPGLAAHGVANAAVDPVLELYDGAGELIATNHRWDVVNTPAEIAAAGEAAGAFPLGAGAADAALVVTLAPGVYTVQATEADPVATGVALVEVYRLP